ncbi:hypothetical protein [Psychrobacter sp. AOP31-A1-22]|uniref:hypothetical protein n=1 Tax=Psychrobacter sp. AOP31-A1-22 TaxID=3457696 RepID=UPI0040352EC8
MTTAIQATDINLVELTNQLAIALTDRVAGDKLGQKIETFIFGHNVEAKADHLFGACEINDIDININGFEYKLAYLSYEYQFNNVTWDATGKPEWNGDFEVTIGNYENNLLWHKGTDAKYPETPETEPVQPFDEDVDRKLANDVLSKVFENIGEDGQKSLAQWAWDNGYT